MHVAAAKFPTAERFITTAGIFSEKQIARIMKKELVPFDARKSKKEEEISAPELETKNPPIQSEITNEKARKLLEIKFINLQETVVDTIKSLKEHKPLIN